MYICTTNLIKHHGKINAIPVRKMLCRLKMISLYCILYIANKITSQHVTTIIIAPIVPPIMPINYISDETPWPVGIAYNFQLEVPLKDNGINQYK